MVIREREREIDGNSEKSGFLNLKGDHLSSFFFPSTKIELPKFAYMDELVIDPYIESIKKEVEMKKVES